MAKTKETGTSMTLWEEKLAARAKKASKSVASNLGGQFISVRSGGIMYYNGKPVINNQLATVVIANVHENAFYTSAFDENSPAAPACFAFGTDPAEMRPHENSSSPQSDKCSTCPRNKFPSKGEVEAAMIAAKKSGARVRKGKECKNLMRLALIPAGTLDGTQEKFTFKPILDPEHYASAVPSFLRVSVTSVRNFAQHVVNMDTIRHRAPESVFTRVYATPDQKNQSATCFDQLEPLVLPQALESALCDRSDELSETISFPYQGSADEAEAPAANGKVKKARKF